MDGLRIGGPTGEKEERGKREENGRGRRNGENIIITFAIARHEHKDIQF
jgi:hypothetical protein